MDNTGFKDPIIFIWILMMGLCEFHPSRHGNSPPVYQKNTAEV